MFTDQSKASAAPVGDSGRVRKFLFDQSFDEIAEPPALAEPEAPPPPVITPDEVEVFKKMSWDQGFASGQKSTADQLTAALTSVLSQVEARLSQLVEGIEAAHKSNEILVRQAVLAIARKLLPDFTAKGGLQEIEALLGSAIGEMLHEPRLVVRIHDAEFDRVNEKINEITARKAYAGKVVVLADPEVAAGDCRIEWADGGVERTTNDVWKAVEAAVAPDDNSTSKE